MPSPPRQIIIETPDGVGPLVLPHPAVDAGLRTLIGSGYRSGAVEVVIDDGAPVILDMACEAARLEEARLRRRRVLKPDKPVREVAPVPTFSGENARGTIRLRVTPVPDRRRPPRYNVGLGNKLVAKDVCSPYRSAVTLLAMRGFAGTIEFARPGARPETIGMATALARLHAGRPIIGRPKPAKRGRGRR